jgi:dipeptidyl-peptidase-4
MPGYDRWEKMAPAIASSFRTGAITPVWSDDSRSFEFNAAGGKWRYRVQGGRLTRVDDAPPEPSYSPPTRSPGAEPLLLARGRGAEADVISPNGANRAFSADRNMWIVSTASKGPPVQVTFDGGAETQVRHGVGSYVYLEEFGVTSPVWWSPDSRKLAWMRYDETGVDAYALTLDMDKTINRTVLQAYPHAGGRNPVADLLVYDLATRKTTVMDVRSGAQASSEGLGHYVWSGVWTGDGHEILVRRADRLQKRIDLAACSPDTGACRTVVEESRPESWASSWAPTFLKDGKRFIWASERTGFRNLYLHHLDGGLITPLTTHAFDVIDVVKVDEKRGFVWYTARSGDNYLKAQLHRVRIDGAQDIRLTDPSRHHRVFISPDGRRIVDVAQSHNQPPVSLLLDEAGDILETLSVSDMSDADTLGLRPSELFTFQSADGVTKLHGLIQYPSNFDAGRRYPVLLNVYGGPGSNSVSETFTTPSPLAEFGFVIVRLDARTTGGRGRRSLDTVYQNLGVAEVDDFAAGLKALRSRSWFDPDRVGVFGVSYGGTVAALLAMKHPDLIQAAVSSSPVADFRLYDTAYSERYLGLPDQNPGVYDQVSPLSYVENLEADLMIYFGTADDNVHPKNALQLINRLQQAGKSFEVQVGPDRGHTALDQTRMMEFFIQTLVINPVSR